MVQVKFLLMMIICVQNAEGFIWNSSLTSHSVCVGNSTSLAWVYTLESGEILSITSWTKSDAAGGLKVLADDFGGFTPRAEYVGRLTWIGSAGIQIHNLTSSDTGTYIVSVTLTSGLEYRMNATVNVHEIANASCIPACDSSLNCQISQACPVQKYTDAVKYPNGFQCLPANNNKPYSVCAEGDAITSCYSGPSLCHSNTCKDKAPNVQCQLVLGLALGLGLGVQCVIIFIVGGIFKCKGYKHPYTHGLVLGLGLGITFIVGCIIIASLISTVTTSCNLELGLGLGLGSGIPCLIAGIIAVIFRFFQFPLFKGIPNRVELGKGILTGLLVTSVIGIIVAYLKYDKLKPEPRSIKPDNKPREPADKKTEEVRLEPTDKKSKTNNSGSSSAVSREHVSVQMEKKGFKSDEEERTTAVRTKSQNKFEPNTISKQTNDRQQPLPPVDTGFEDTPKYRQLPQPPQNGEIKDRNLRGLSATIEDTPGLANETPRPNKLPPLTTKQETVQEVDASEKPKKKGKKNKKKDQMNEKTPEDKNSGTILRVN